MKKGKIIIDDKSCSIFYENILKKKFLIAERQDPIYYMKSIKNKTEIKNMINSHISDGVALTKFLYWIKKKKKQLMNFRQTKLEILEKIKIIYILALIQLQELEVMVQ